jgi:hypothetical protein
MRTDAAGGDAISIEEVKAADRCVVKCGIADPRGSRRPQSKFLIPIWLAQGWREEERRFLRRVPCELE